jgi:membrane-associated protein
VIAMLLPMLFGIKWMDPEWLLQQFHTEFVWLVLVIIFIECGLFFPFLPGDTLLFAVGLFIATGKLDYIPGPDLLELAVGLAALAGAAFLGNVTGYEIGRGLGHRVRNHDGKIVKKTYLDKTDDFFDRHGSKALVIGRFVPFVRTYITLVAGVTEMDRRKFLLWSAVGAVLWVGIITPLGFFLGQTFPWLSGKIDYVVIGLVLLSVIPVAIEWWRHRGSDDEREKAHA